MPDENVLSAETKSKHTPGPWHYDRKGLVGPRSTADDQSRGFIIPVADVYSDNKEGDCRLIAAAPDLLDALDRAEVALTIALLNAGVDRASVQRPRPHSDLFVIRKALERVGTWPRK